MKALTFHGKRDVRVDDVPEPSIQEPTDAKTVTGVDLVPERLAMAERHGVTTIDAEAQDDAPSVIREMTDGRGPDGEAVRRQVIDSEGVHIGAEPWVAHRTPTRCSRRRSTVQ